MADEPGAQAPEPVIEQPKIEAPVAPEPQPVAPVINEPLPADSRDRTRDQFQKLIESNRRLYERNMQLETQVQQPRVPEPVQRPAQTVDPRDFIEVDPATGDKFINEQKLRERLEESNQKFSALQRTIDGYMKTSEDREVERQERETYGAYPELNPDTQTFDPAFNRYVRGILTDSFYNTKEYGGRPMSFKEAADYVRAQFPKAKEEAKETDKVAQAAQQAKEQAVAQPQSQPRAQQQMADDQLLENLKYRTRYLNDDEALAIRIVNTDHIRKEEAS